jgi:hypothetical protein
MTLSSNGKGTFQQDCRTVRVLLKEARARGLVFFGAPGVGKSRYFGRVLCWLDFVDEMIGQAVIDPIGGTIDNFLSKIVTILRYLPESEHQKVWERIIYVDMHDTDGYISPFPLYYTLQNESLWEISDRPLQTFLKSDPNLLTAPRSGWNALRKIGTYTGMALKALNEPITSAEEFLRNPSQYFSRLSRAQSQYPELAEVLSYFRNEYGKLRPSEREQLSGSFKEKIFPFTLNPTLGAIVGGNAPAINWPEVAEKKQIVLLDFRHVQGEMRRFLLLWVFDCIYAYIKTRGRNPQSFGLIIDEFVALTQKVVGENPMTQELAEFIQQYQRGAQIWLSIGLQSPLSLDHDMQQTVLSLGTLIIGQAPTKAAAGVLADTLCFPNPHHIKHERVIQRNPYSYRGVLTVPEPQIEPVFMPMPEQRELFIQRIQRLGRYSFMLRPALSEGAISTDVYPIHIRDVDRNRETGELLFPDKQLMERLRSILAAKSGIPLTDILKEQEAWLTADTSQTPQRTRTVPESRHPDVQPSTLPARAQPNPHHVKTNPSLPTLDEHQQAMLAYLVSHPDSPVTDVYKGLGIGAGQGTRLRDSLKALGLVAELELRTGSVRGGRPARLLIPTFAAWELVGKDAPSGRGGILHRHIQQMVVDGAKAKGYSAAIEQPLENGTIVDVALTTGDGVRIAVEIALGSRADRELTHISNSLAAGFDQVYVIFYDEHLLGKTATAIHEAITGEELEKVRLLPLRHLAQVG